MEYKLFKLEATESGPATGPWRNYLLRTDGKNIRIGYHPVEDRFSRTHDAQRLEALPVADAIKSAIRGLA